MTAALHAVSSASSASRAELFRLLGDEDRLRILALCAEDELTVGELAVLLKESQPQLTKKSQPLREAGLVHARRDGTRTLLRAVAVEGDAVIAAGLEAGRALCAKDGTLARVAVLVAQREELSKKKFDAPMDEAPPKVDADVAALVTLLPVVRALLPAQKLAVDVGTGEGALLPLLSPLYERVIAVDRSAARLARCALTIEGLALGNVRLRQCDVDDVELAQDVAKRGGADLVVMARVLRHVARPQDAVRAAARLLARGGHLVVVDALPHDDESARERGDVWLGFEPPKLRNFLESAGLSIIEAGPLPREHLQMAVGKAA